MYLLKTMTGILMALMHFEFKPCIDDLNTGIEKLD